MKTTTRRSFDDLFGVAVMFVFPLLGLAAVSTEWHAAPATPVVRADQAAASVMAGTQSENTAPARRT
jgi:hypothetical protein